MVVVESELVPLAGERWAELEGEGVTSVNTSLT